MTDIMTLKSYRKLKKRDFDNGAVVDAIDNAIKRGEHLFNLCKELDVEMESHGPIPATAAAILNAIRIIVNDER